ncbi:hypothetical protein NPIL_454931, partial [Nephila pilipes]
MLDLVEHSKLSFVTAFSQNNWNELILTCACLAEKEADLATFKSKLARNGSITPVFDSS